MDGSDEGTLRMINILLSLATCWLSADRDV